MIIQKTILVNSPKRGVNLITGLIKESLGELPENGLLNIFLQHTSASLTINENADPSVRVDMENATNCLVPEGQKFYTHTAEGEDDMPAHIKSSIFGCSLTIPIMSSRLALGAWQGIYLFEHRNNCDYRKLIVSIYA